MYKTAHETKYVLDPCRIYFFLF